MRNYVLFATVLMMASQAMASPFYSSKYRIDTALSYAPLAQLVGNKSINAIAIDGNDVLVTADNCTYKVTINATDVQQPDWGLVTQLSVGQLSGPICK